MKIKSGLLLPPAAPDYVAGRFYLFTYNDERYPYTALATRLSYWYGEDNALLIAVFGLNYRHELEKIYGYSPGFCSWPTWRANDPSAGQRVLEALVGRGVEIKV